MDIVMAASQVAITDCKLVQSQRTPYVIDCLNLPDAQERRRSKILKETPWFSSVVPNISDLTSAVDSTHFLSVRRYHPAHLFQL
jgi:hypothetical protein